MTIHNLMEDLVFNEVNKVFDVVKEKNEPWLTCDCLQCRLDTICYVLNRMEPRYIKSGRGMAHFMQLDKSQKTQLYTDISILAFKGMKVVMEKQRSHMVKEQILPAGPVFNFPTISGRIVDGQTFASVDDITVSLYLEEILVSQISSSWDNPYRISKNTQGGYTFWPFPVSASNIDENRIFNFYIHSERKGYETIHYHFKLGLTSEPSARTNVDAYNCHNLPDLYFFEE